MGSSSPPVDDLTTIIIPCHNQIEFTRRCLRAIAQHTSSPFEVVAIDNGSSDGTSPYLAGVSDVASFPVRVITNLSNRGFPAAVNQGLAAARGKYLVLLNNDAVVPIDWLDQLKALADSDAAIGMVGPMSNYASPPQLVADASYENLDEMFRFAAAWRRERLGTWFETEKLSGFCLLVKRAVFQAVGGLDERFGIGLFDDDDLSLRVRLAGYRLCVAYDLFVHHYGSRTFVGSGVDQSALLRENQVKFVDKWGPLGPSVKAVTLSGWMDRTTTSNPTEELP